MKTVKRGAERVARDSKWHQQGMTQDVHRGGVLHTEYTCWEHFRIGRAQLQITLKISSKSKLELRQFTIPLMYKLKKKKKRKR